MKNWLLAGCLVFTIAWLGLYLVPLPDEAPRLPGSDRIVQAQSLNELSTLTRHVPPDLVIGLGFFLLIGLLLNFYPPVLPERKFVVPGWSFDGLVGSVVWVMAAMGTGYTASKLLAHRLSDPFFFHAGSTAVLQLTLLLSVVLLVVGFGESFYDDLTTGVDSWLRALSHGTVEYTRIYPVLFLTLILNQLLVLSFNYSAAPRSYLFILTADSGLKLPLLVLLTCVLAPLAEEVFFRGILYRSLRSILGTGPAALLGGGVFAVIHFEVQLFLPLLVLGYLLCVIYEKSGSIKVVITMHFLQNTISLLIFHRLLIH